MNAPKDSPQAHLAHLEAVVRQRVSGLVRSLHIVVEENGLVLNGSARTYYAKQLAQHAAMNACPLPIRANRIEVG
jgi:hypothetical protein